MRQNLPVTPKVIIVRNPDQVVVLVVKNGRVTQCTHPELVGKEELDAKLSATSFLRWHSDQHNDRLYPEEVILEGSAFHSPLVVTTVMPACIQSPGKAGGRLTT